MTTIMDDRDSLAVADVMDHSEQALNEGPGLPGPALESEPERDYENPGPVSECANEDGHEPGPEETGAVPEAESNIPGDEVERPTSEVPDVVRPPGRNGPEPAQHKLHTTQEGDVEDGPVLSRAGCGATVEATAVQMKSAPPQSTPAPWYGVAVPDRFRIDRDGVYETSDRDKGVARIAGPVWVSAHTRDDAGLHYGIVVSFIDLRGNLVEMAFPRDILHAKDWGLVQCLARRGLAIVPGKEGRVSAYLGSFDSTEGLWKLSAPKIGWLDSIEGQLIYVHPAADGGVIALHGGDRIIFQPEQHSASLHTMRRQGGLADWQQQVALPCRNNHYLVAALCFAFAPPLLKAAAAESGGIHYYGRSSRGKTTAGQVAASIYGCGADPSDAPDHAFVQRWNTTPNGLEAVLAAHNDNLLVLDEIHTCDAKDFGKVIYNLAGGKGKLTMTKDRNLKAPRTWRTLVFSTGEISSKQKIEEDNKQARAGQLLRLIDIPVHENIIMDTHGVGPADFVLRLKRACGQFYGSAGPAFIKALIRRFDNFHHFSTTIRQRLAASEEFLALPNMEPEQRRALRRFALILVAGGLAVELGILPFDKAEIASAVKEIIKAWLTDGATIPDRIRGVMALQDFIQRNPALFSPVGINMVRAYELAGYTQKVSTGGTLYLIFPEAFAEACGGHDPDEVASELKRLGLLKTTERKRLKSKHTVTINGEDRRIRLYAVWDQILEFDYAEATNAASQITDGATGASGAED